MHYRLFSKEVQPLSQRTILIILYPHQMIEFQELKVLLPLGPCIFFDYQILRLMFIQIFLENAWGFIYDSFLLYGLQLNKKSVPEYKIKLGFSKDLFLKRNKSLVTKVLHCQGYSGVCKEEEPRATKKLGEK